MAAAGRKVGTRGINSSYSDVSITIQEEEPNENENGNIQPLETSSLAKMVVSSPRFSLGTIEIPAEFKKKNRCSLQNLIRSIGTRLTTVGRKCFGDGDWLFLAVLGLGMALFSFAMDDCIERVSWTRSWLYRKAGGAIGVQYLCWTGSKLILALLATFICQYVAPQATGSGIPEMKTILRGVVLREYLTLRTLSAKAVSLTLCLGSEIPIGKEGPFVHICSIIATLLLKLMSSFRKGYKNESVRMDMLAAACAVGVACTFGAPIGGVLFSIEVTSVYFAVRNYWRGFFAATCSAILFRMASTWFKFEPSPLAFSQTSFSTANPFQPEEMFVYIAIGLFCGLAGPVFVIAHSKFLYTSCVIILISSLTFPGGGPGEFAVASISPKAAISDFFTSFSWQNTSANFTRQAEVFRRWTPKGVSIYVSLASYALCNFITSCLANTLPIPTGIFIPTFVVGAAFGRMVGEFLYTCRLNGFFGDAVNAVVPGSYALVGAAAFTGSVTHTISISVIVFELTGQIVYILPVMIATKFKLLQVGCLISNIISAFISTSFFESIILIKELPYLPDMLPVESKLHNFVVKQFMTHVSEMKYVTLHTNIGRIKEMVASPPKLQSFPLVDSSSSMILLGSIPRPELIKQVEECIGDKVRLEAAKRVREVENDERLVETILLSHKRRTRDSDCSDNSSTKKVSPVTNKDEEENDESPKESKGSEDGDSLSTTDSMKRRPLNRLVTALNKRRQSLEGLLQDYDMTQRERALWEKAQLQKKLDLHRLHIDSAPIRLIEHTSLHKCHALFSLLSLQCAYVTRLGRLVGVVTLSDIRRALQHKPEVPDEDPEEHSDADELEEEQEKTKRRKINNYGLSGHKTSEGLIAVALQPLRARKLAIPARPSLLATIEEQHPDQPPTRLWC